MFSSYPVRHTVYKYALLAVFTVLVFSSLTLHAALPVFPDWSLQTLSGKTIRTANLVKPTVFVVGFKYQQQSMINAWVKALLKKQSFSVHELAYVPSAWKRYSSRIEPFMVSRLPDDTWKNFVAPLYGEKSEIMRALKAASDSDVYVYLVSSDRKVIARSQGYFTEQKLSKLLSYAQP